MPNLSSISARGELILSCAEYHLPYRNVGLDVIKIINSDPIDEAIKMFFYLKKIDKRKLIKNKREKISLCFSLF